MTGWPDASLANSAASIALRRVSATAAATSRSNLSKDDPELFAVDPVGRSLSAGPLLEQPAVLLEDRIARRMPVRVVHLLEVVDVAVDDRYNITLPGRRFQGLLQVDVECLLVAQAG